VYVCACDLYLFMSRFLVLLICRLKRIELTHHLGSCSSAVRNESDSFVGLLSYIVMFPLDWDYILFQK